MGPWRCPGGVGRGRHSDCLPPLTCSVDALVSVQELATPIEGTETLQLEGREVCRQALLGLQLLVGELVCQVQTFTPQLWRELEGLMFSCVGGELHQDCPLVAAWPANVADCLDGLRRCNSRAPAWSCSI